MQEKAQQEIVNDQLEVAHSIEVKQLQLQIKDMTTQIQLIKDDTEAKMTELKAQHDVVETTTSSKIKSLQNTLSTMDAKITGVISSKDSEIKAKTVALQEKSAVISGMSEQLTKAREYLATNQQVLQASITWKQCAELPTKLKEGKTTVINGKVYCGGGVADARGDERIVYCYDPSQDVWTTLPPLPVIYFGLGKVSGKLVAVGGMIPRDVKVTRRNDNKGSQEVYTYDEQSQRWKQMIPHMPTARHSPGVLSLQSALVVAGGCTSQELANTVEIFKPDTQQWYRTDPLPIDCCDVSLTSDHRLRSTSSF